MEKAFEKQLKIKVRKKTDALEKLKDQNKQLVNVNDDEDKLLHSKEREIFIKIYTKKKKKKIEELTRKIDGNDLIFTILSTGDTIDFSQKKNDPLTLL